MKRFSDFADTPKVLDGKKIKVEDVIDQEIQTGISPQVPCFYM